MAVRRRAGKSPSDHAPGPGVARSVTRRRRLPGSRAVVGGFLVTASAAGVFGAWAGATSGPRAAYVVVTTDKAAGEVIDQSELALVPIDLPSAQARLSYTSLPLVAGATVLAPLAANQLVQAPHVAKPAGGSRTAQISVAVEPGAALGADRRFLRPGERVDVIATTTAGGETTTETVSAGVEVVAVLVSDRGVGSAGAVTVVVAAAPRELEAIAQAAVVGAVTLARTTGLER